MKILLGMSGGVDSCAAAKVLQNDGFEVVGCCLLLTENAHENSPETLRAKQAAERLGIDFITVDCRDEFRRLVMEPFANAYALGKTPNPCVACNPAVKIAALCRAADALGIEAVATGHYAKINRGNGVRLCCADSPKDQTYFLYRLSPAQLDRLYFPLGTFTDKAEIRLLAQQAGFEAANAKDSQEICFLPDGEYASFITDRLGIESKPGDFLDLDGNVIGTHNGIIYYTTGQRKGLGAFGKPMYVKSICPADNTVTLCAADERFADRATVEDLTWCSGTAPSSPFTAQVKIRSTAKAAPCEITLQDDIAYLRFETPQLSPSRGQSAVFYDGDTVLGGGFIV